MNTRRTRHETAMIAFNDTHYVFHLSDHIRRANARPRASSVVVVASVRRRASRTIRRARCRRPRRPRPRRRPRSSTRARTTPSSTSSARTARARQHHRRASGRRRRRGVARAVDALTHPIVTAVLVTLGVCGMIYRQEALARQGDDAAFVRVAHEIWLGSEVPG